jgi:hypothetical protein
MARLPPTGRASPASASGSFAATFAPSSDSVSDLLRDLELEAAEDDDYSLLDGSQPSSFASVPLPPPMRTTRSRSRVQGTYSPVFTTPVSHGGGQRGGSCWSQPVHRGNFKRTRNPHCSCRQGHGQATTLRVHRRSSDGELVFWVDWVRGAFLPCQEIGNIHPLRYTGARQGN